MRPESDVALPDFLLIGAMKCGTSTLQTQLALQDGVFMTTPKEPNFFSNDEIYVRGRQWYEDLFANAALGDMKGEASTHYTKLPTYPDTLSRMRELLPAPRLIYMIRNPLARAVSHYIHEWTQGAMLGNPYQAFRSHPELVEYGCYGMQIAPYIEAYGTDRVFLTSLEQIKADPDGEFSRISRFLDLSEKNGWSYGLPPQNVSAERIRRFPLQGLLVDNPVARTLRQALVPKRLRRWVRSSRTMKFRPEIPPQLEESMKARFLKDRARLAEFFPDHPALNFCYPFASARPNE